MIGGFGGSEFGVILIVIVVAYIIFRKSSGTGNKHIASSLVLSKFDIEDDQDNKVDIVGRSSGLSAWILTNLGFSAETRFSITDGKVVFKNSSISGQNYRVLPFTSASSTQCGYSKSISALILGSILVVGGLILGLGNGSGVAIILGLIIGGIPIYNYYNSKMILITVETSGGTIFGLSFKQSNIENVSVDIDRATKVIDILNHEIIESHKSQRSV